MGGLLCGRGAQPTTPILRPPALRPCGQSVSHYHTPIIEHMVHSGHVVATRHPQLCPRAGPAACANTPLEPCLSSAPAPPLTARVGGFGRLWAARCSRQEIRLYRATERLATASGARASRLRSRRFHGSGVPGAAPAVARQLRLLGGERCAIAHQNQRIRAARPRRRRHGRGSW